MICTMMTEYECILKNVAKNLKCSICLCVYKEPVTLCCGHNYCLECINMHFKQDVRSGCPECREKFRTSKLRKNVALSNILEAGGGLTWDEIGSESDEKGWSCLKNKETLLRRHESLKSEIKKIENVLSELCPESAPNVLDGRMDGQIEEMAAKENEDSTTKEPVASTSQETDFMSQDTDLMSQDTDQMSQDTDQMSQNATETETQRSAGNSTADYTSPPEAPYAVFAQLTFSPHLGHKRLDFSNNGRKVMVGKGRRSSPVCSDRFAISQWMAEQEFSVGAHYWEVDTSGSNGWAVGVAYGSLSREDRLGRTSTSWCVEWSSKRLSFWHNSREVSLKHDCPERVRVVLDMSGGSLSFYSRAENALLHNVQENFSKPVSPVFWLYGLQPRNSLSFPTP